MSSSGFSDNALFYFSAVVATAVPVYFFISTRDAPLTLFLAIAIIVGLAVRFLPEAYQIVFERSLSKLDSFELSDPKTSGLTKAAAIVAQKEHTESKGKVSVLKREAALGRALGHVNAVYIVAAIAASLVFKDADPAVNFALSGGLGVMAAYYLGIESGKPRKRS